MSQPVPHAAPHRVLIVDDDRRIRTMLGQFLQERGLTVAEAGDGQSMFALLKQAHFDVVILDVMLPGDDGFTLCRRLRADSTIPVILLTAINDASDRVAGLELGADDYVAKPFDPRELLARIRAVLRRQGTSQPAAREQATYSFSGWALDPRRRTLRNRQNVLVDLTSGEFDLLLAFVEYPQQILHRDRLLDLARGRINQAFDRSIDVQISRLRRKLELDPAQPQLIKTVRSEGYIFTADVSSLQERRA
jgi:two-component system OmpR family response regulator